MERFFAAMFAAAVIAAGCEEEPAGPAMPEPPPLKPSVDEQMAEALKLVDPDLIYKRVPLPDEENAFTLWAEAMEKLVPIEGAEEHARRLKRYREEIGDRLAELYGREFKRDPGVLGHSAEHSWDMGQTELERFFESLRRAEVPPPPEGETARRFAEWLGRNQEVFDLVDAGIARGRLQLPVRQYAVPDFGYFPRTVQYIALMRAAKARVLAWAGDFDAAARELLTAQRMGELLAESEGGYDSFAEILIILGLGARDLIRLSGMSDVPEDVLELLIAGLPPLSRMGEALAQSLRVKLTDWWIPSIRGLLEEADDRKLRLSLPDEAGKWGLDFSGEAGKAFVRGLEAVQLDVIDPAETLGMVSRYYAKFVRNATGTWKGRIKGLDAEVERWRMKWEEPYKDALRAVKQASADDRAVTEGEMAAFVQTLDNAMGRGLLAMELPATNSFVGSYFEFRAGREAARTVIALRLYEIRHGKLPATLAELVTDGILKRVPRDVFSDGELLYSRERRVVWSVGQDEKDDGGDPRDADRSRAGRRDVVWRVPVPE